MNLKILIICIMNMFNLVYGQFNGLFLKNNHAVLLADFIEEMIEDSQCSIIILDLNEKNQDFSLVVSQLQENFRDISYHNDLKSLFDFVKEVKFKICIHQIFIGSIEDMKVYIEQMWKYFFTQMHYEYTVFTPSLDEIQSISILKDFFYLRIVKYTKDQFLVIKINPFLELNKLQTIDIWSLKTKQFIQNKSLLRTSYPTNFRGTVLKVAFMFSPPYVLEISGSPRIKTGLEYKIVSTIGESLNYKTNFTESVDCQWGSTDENGSWTGIIGMIERREADIGIGTITRTYDRAQAVDFSLGFVEQFLTFFAHVPQELPKWQAILWPFDKMTWLMVFLTMIIFFIFYVLVYGGTTSEKKGISVSTALIQTWSSFLNQGINHPKELYLRILLGTWFLYSYCIILSYGGSLISFLTSTYKEKPIESLQDIVKGDLFVTTLEGTLYESLFEGSDVSIYQKIWEKQCFKDTCDVRCIDHFECLKNIHFDPKISYMIDGDSFHQLYLKKYNLFNVYMTKLKFYNSEFAFPIHKNFPALTYFNERLAKLIEMGLIQHWKVEMSQISLKVDENVSEIDMSLYKPKSGTQESISLDHLQGAFLVFSVGMMGSFFMFLFEKI
ncbi:uncharacterized protein [Lepeophtheirus salmonis]|uniref:uncharacterized protein isoform X2 n=1 Tax=Lepeophtheirus salmonis TaxID=72036 RepID=UPI003AF3D13B